MEIPKTLANYTIRLTAGISASDTSFTLSTSLDPEGGTFSGLYGITFDIGTSKEEHIIATLTGSSGTVVKRGLSRVDALTEVSDNKYAHGQATVTFTDYPIIVAVQRLLSGTEDFNTVDWTGVNSIDDLATPTSGELTKAANVDFVNSIAIAGSPDSSTVTKGIAKISVAPASATNPITVGDNDPRVPSQDENDALVGTSGTPSSSNKYITSDDVSTSSTANAVPRADAGGLLNSWIQLEKEFINKTAFENVVDNGLVKLINDAGTVKIREINGLSAIQTKTFGAIGAGKFKVVQVDDNKIVIAVPDGGSGGTVVAASIDSAGVATFGGSVGFSGGGLVGSDEIDLCQTGTDKFCAIVCDNGAITDSIAVVGTVSGTTITLGTVQVVTGNAANGKGTIGIVKTDTDEVLTMTWVSGSNIMYRLGTITGTSISFQSTTVNSTLVADSDTPISAISLGTDKVLIAYEATNLLKLKIYTLSGTDLTGGTVFSVTGAGSEDWVSVYSLATDTVIVAWGDIARTAVNVESCTISGTTLTSVRTWQYDESGATGNLDGVCVTGDGLDRFYLIANFDSKVTAWAFSCGTNMKFAEIDKQVLGDDNQVHHRSSAMYNDQLFFYGSRSANDVDFTNGVLDHNDFFGIADAAITADNGGNIFIGGVANDLSGLEENCFYYVGRDGSLTENDKESFNSNDFSNSIIGRSIESDSMRIFPKIIT